MKGMEAFYAHLDGMTEAIKEKCLIIAGETAAEMERYAKENRRWNDITDDARKGLRGKVATTNHSIAAQIWQDMYGMTGKEYGYWLENAERFHGKYAILEETRNAHAGMFFDGIEAACGLKLNRL